MAMVRTTSPLAPAAAPLAVSRLAPRRGLDALAWAAGLSAALSLVGMSAAEGWQVFARYVLNDSPGWTEPLTLLLMLNGTLMGAAVAVRRETHFRFMALSQQAPAVVRAALALVGRLVTLAIGLALAWWGGGLMVDDWDVPMAGTGLPDGLNQAPLVLGGLLIALFALERMVSPGSPAEGGHIGVED